MTHRTNRDVRAYYDQDIHIAKSTGAGLIWFMGGDHLSPPLSNADHHALQSANWRNASSERVVELAKRMGIAAGQVALELGCGIGGPGRDVTAATGAFVIGLNISGKQLKNMLEMSSAQGSPYTRAVQADMQHLPFKDECMDHVYSINAIYHTSEPEAVIAESHRVLKPRGALGIDDWFTTNRTTPEQLAQLRYNWSTSAGGFHNFDNFVGSINRCGFSVREVIDFTDEAGEFLSEARFGATYDQQIAPVLLDAFPQLYKYEGYEPAHADMAVNQLRSDVLYMGELYRGGGAVYRQIIAEKQ